MRIIRNILLTLICIAAVGAAAVFGYYRVRGSREAALMSEGLALMEQGNYRAARTRFASAQEYENSITRRLSTDTMEEDLYRYTAICDFRLGDYEKAGTIYDNLLRRHPKDPVLLSSRATVWAALGNMEEAVPLFDTAIAIDRSNYSRLYDTGLTMREYGNDKDAKRYFNKLLKIDAKKVDPVIRGQALCFVGKHKEAAAVLDSIENPDMQTSFLFATAMEKTGAHEEALKILDDYEDQIREDPDMLNLKGNALFGLGRYEEALACFDQALQLAEKGTALRRSLMFNRIAVLEQLRDFKGAAEYAAIYAKEFPGDKAMERENLFLQTR